MLKGLAVSVAEGIAGRLDVSSGMAAGLVPFSTFIVYILLATLNTPAATSETSEQLGLEPGTTSDEVGREGAGQVEQVDGISVDNVAQVDERSSPAEKIAQEAHSSTTPASAEGPAKNERIPRRMTEKSNPRIPRAPNECLPGWPEGNDTTVASLLRHLALLQDVVVVHNHFATPSILWKTLHASTRSLEINQLEKIPAVAAGLRHTPHKLCLYLLQDTGWRSWEVQDSERMLDAWSERCMRLLVVETLQSVEQSLGARLVRYDHTLMTLSVMLDDGRDGEGGGDDDGGSSGDVQRVYGFQVDCVQRKLLKPELLWDAAEKSGRGRSHLTHCAQESYQASTILFQENMPRLRGQHLRVTSTAAGGGGTYYAYFPDPNDRSHLAGVEKNMVDAAADHLGFTYSHTPPDSEVGLYGTLLENGSWAGVVGMVTRGEAHIAIGDISVTLERLSAVDFTYPHQVEPNSFVMLRPAALPRWLAVAAPFDPPMWLLLALALGTALLAASLPGVLVKRKGAGPRAAALFLFGALLNQAGYLPVRALSGRILVAAWWLFGFTIAIGYQTRLTSLLSVAQYPPPVDSLDQLARSQLQVKLIPQVAVTDYLVNLGGTGTGRLTERISYFSVTENLNDLEFQPDTVYVEELTIARRAAKERPDPHRYYVSRARFFATGLAWPVPRGACFKAPLNTVIQRLVQAGLVEFWLEREGGQVGSTPPPPPPQQRALRLWDLGAAFLVLAAGSIASTACFLLEVLVAGRQRGQRGEARGERWRQLARVLVNMGRVNAN